MSIVAAGIALAKNVFALHVSVWRALMNGRARGLRGPGTATIYRIHGLLSKLSMICSMNWSGRTGEWLSTT